MRYLRTAGAVIAACAVGALRVAGLGTYPLLNPDEGFWSAGARNFVLFGDSLMDGRLHPFLSPGTFVLLSGWFNVFAPGLVSARAFSVTLGLATCVLVAVLGRRSSPDQPWLLPVVFAFSAFTLLIHRVMLLEAHQVFWLVVAAVAWLSSPRPAAAAATGAALGCALLVKSNSVYVLPAFLLTIPTGPGESSTARWRRGVALAAAVLAIAGLGYAIAWRIDPSNFATAFRYELDGNHFADEGVLFRVGRFGLHPARLVDAVIRIGALDPVLIVLAAAGLIMVLRGWRAATRADRLFAAWAVLGAAFHLGQIYIEVRYFSTLAPALAWLAALRIQRWFAVPGRTRRIAVALASGLVALGTFRVVRGIAKQPNADYWTLVAWVTSNVPTDSPALVAPAIGISLPQRSYDFFRLVNPYSAPPVPLASIVDRLGIRVIVVDDEWRTYASPDMDSFIATRCVRRITIGRVDVYEVRRMGAG